MARYLIRTGIFRDHNEEVQTEPLKVGCIKGQCYPGQKNTKIISLIRLRYFNLPLGKHTFKHIVYDRKLHVILKFMLSGPRVLINAQLVTI